APLVEVMKAILNDPPALFGFKQRKMRQTLGRVLPGDMKENILVMGDGFDAHRSGAVNKISAAKSGNGNGDGILPACFIRNAIYLKKFIRLYLGHRERIKIPLKIKKIKASGDAQKCDRNHDVFAQCHGRKINNGRQYVYSILKEVNDGVQQDVNQ